jgi:hypothetical protein
MVEDSLPPMASSYRTPKNVQTPVILLRFAAHWRLNRAVKLVGKTPANPLL